MDDRTYVFYYHMNKPASKKYGTPLMTVHWRGECHLTENVLCDVPTWTHHNHQQPRVVVKGRASDMDVTYHEKNGDYFQEVLFTHDV